LAWLSARVDAQKLVKMIAIENVKQPVDFAAGRETFW
jgi:hypothetical protein